MVQPPPKPRVRPAGDHLIDQIAINTHTSGPLRKLIFHSENGPTQITGVANHLHISDRSLVKEYEAFSPSAEEITYAKEVVAGYNDAQKRGAGVCMVGDGMVPSHRASRQPLHGSVR